MEGWAIIKSPDALLYSQRLRADATNTEPLSESSTAGSRKGSKRTASRKSKMSRASTSLEEKVTATSSGDHREQEEEEETKSLGNYYAQKPNES